MIRYYVTNDSLIPIYGQPENGYTKLQAIARAQREIDHSVKLFKVSRSECASWFHIIDTKGRYCNELDTAI